MHDLPETIDEFLAFYEARRQRMVDRLSEILIGGSTPSVASSPAPGAASPPITGTQVKRFSSDVTLADLIDAGLLEPGEEITFDRPMIGQLHKASITAKGTVLLDGQNFPTLSAAANAATGGSHNGWKVWSVVRLGGVPLESVRNRLKP